MMVGTHDASDVLTIANKLYVKSGYKLKAKLIGAAKKFGSEIELLNFDAKSAAAAKINGWVEEKTNGKINNIVSPEEFDELTRLVLVNAVYFKGA